MKKILIGNIFIFLLHLIVIQDAYYLKPINWFIFVWLLDLTLLAMMSVNLLGLIIYEWRAKK